jgi:MFS family permease
MTNLGDQRPTPEGPRHPASYAWTVWLLSALFFFYAFFQRVAPSVMVEDLMRDFAVNAAVLGNLAAFYFYAYAGMQLPVGMAVDAWGPRRVLTVAGIACGIGSLIFATADSLWAAYLGRLLVGGGAAFGFVGNLKLAANWFPPRRFALMSGLTMMVGMAGGIGGQAPLAALVEGVGWRPTMTGAAVFILVLAPTIWLVVRHEIPAEMPRPAPDAVRPGVLSGLGHTLRTPQILIVGLFGICMAATMLAFGALWSVPYLMTAHDLSRPEAAASVSIMLVGWAIGAPLAGWVSDHIGRRRRPLVVSAVTALTSFAAMIYLPGIPLWAVQVLFFVNGAASGATTISFAVVRENIDARWSGSALAFINMSFTASGALFQPFVGWLLDLNWDGRVVDGARVYSITAYESALFTFVVLGVVALAALVFVRETHCKPMHQVD